MITLYSFGPNLGLPDPSPFVLRLMTYLRMSGIEFEARPNVMNLRKAPKGKLPFIEDDTEQISDTYFICQHLKSRYGDTLNEHLSESQKAQSYLTIKAIDDHFYWCVINSRWLCKETWPLTRESFFGSLPGPLKAIIPPIARRGIKDAMFKQGLGRHSDDELFDIADKMLHSLSVMLGDQDYFFGDQPSELDAVAFGFVAQLTLAEIDNPLNKRARSYTNLLAFSERVHQRYFPAEKSA